jgi:hypothetical protein
MTGSTPAPASIDRRIGSAAGVVSIARGSAAGPDG